MTTAQQEARSRTEEAIYRAFRRAANDGRLERAAKGRGLFRAMATIAAEAARAPAEWLPDEMDVTDVEGL